MIRIREAAIDDLPALLEIYNYAICNLTATFDLQEQTLEDRKKWFEHHGAEYPLIVAEEDENVIGYSSLSPFNEKLAYSATSEVSIYIAPNQQGKGVGSLLMQQILKQARQLNYHTVISGITGGNGASIHLHEKFGFVLAGTLREVGNKFDEWQDVHYYQLILRD
ncbi:GNAT family N-acetyltransferase [Oceanobacillus bengalensis]|uniref:N-acetyltransferase family protein n=1 Tax=Oceanobacillus bengalensis TaxID=1435466 RepID=A0A494YZA2_9BACI|nr:GNAT family N-acetyltransferase [Oceanobacillus bengalensis]RKQ15547.1 N-acetyltransferase family protein [Oceanobacillus bengalensis]